jgi:hypothetical protein
LRSSREEWGKAQFFYEFDDFADVMNWYLADGIIASPFRLQELPDNDVGTAETGPMVGRVYAVFYNQIQLGRLEIHGDLTAEKRELKLPT